MDHDEPTYRDYARWARMSLEDIARDCDVQAFRASGPGGQCVNTTDSAVRMTHVPSGMTATSRESRSQFRNRQLCLQKPVSYTHLDVYKRQAVLLLAER